ncbi:MAG: hypothetical protein IPL20_15565 [Saprospiraceae bacterium]|nr:hypothetical protein [Saprospiraceae bacterium]
MMGGVPSDVIDRSVAFGQKIAEVVFEYSKTDGGHEVYLDPFQLPFTLPTDDYCWAPTGAALQPLSQDGVQTDLSFLSM